MAVDQITATEEPQLTAFNRMWISIFAIALLTATGNAQSWTASEVSSHPSPGAAQATVEKATDGVSVSPNPPLAAPAPLHGNFFERFGQAYRQDWKGAPSGGEEPKFRGFPAPEDDPPFPFTIWPYGGSVTVGYPWTQSGPLMQAIWSGSSGDLWKKSGVQIYGWLNGGFNLSTSTHGHYANAPAAYYLVPNTFQPDQETFYIERQPDTVQRDHFDWGFRLTSLYGIDYRFTTAKGWFSQQLLGRVNPDGSVGKEYGYDLVMAYIDLYFPRVAEGLDVRVGRYISLPDIEAQLAPNNYTYSHSLLYTFDAYTQTGINMTFKLSDRWLYQVGLSAGNDVAPWVGEPDAKPTLNTCLGYTWTQGGDNLYGCANSLNSGKYSYNNVQSAYLTWYHKFNSKWHTATETWYMYEKDVPNLNNPAASPLLVRNANGAFCNNATELTCFAPEWAILNYVERQLSKKDYLTFRNEYFDDLKGQRTGTKTAYTEHEFAYGHWIGTSVLLRPELRFERSYDARAYSSGTKHNQFVAAADLIFFF